MFPAVKEQEKHVIMKVSKCLGAWSGDTKTYPLITGSWNTFDALILHVGSNSEACQNMMSWYTQAKYNLWASLVEPAAVPCSAYPAMQGGRRVLRSWYVPLLLFLKTLKSVQHVISCVILYLKWFNERDITSFPVLQMRKQSPIKRM